MPQVFPDALLHDVQVDPSGQYSPLRCFTTAFNPPVVNFTIIPGAQNVALSIESVYLTGGWLNLAVQGHWITSYLTLVVGGAAFNAYKFLLYSDLPGDSDQRMDYTKILCDVGAGVLLSIDGDAPSSSLTVTILYRTVNYD
jgi:hypothetical protein